MTDLSSPKPSNVASASSRDDSSNESDKDTDHDVCMITKYITGKTIVQKAICQQAQKKRKMLEILKTFVSTCHNHPEVYQNSQLSFFREFVSEVSNDHTKYPPAISATKMMYDKIKILFLN